MRVLSPPVLEDPLPPGTLVTTWHTGNQMQARASRNVQAKALLSSSTSHQNRALGTPCGHAPRSPGRDLWCLGDDDGRSPPEGGAGESLKEAGGRGGLWSVGRTVAGLMMASGSGGRGESGVGARAGGAVAGSSGEGEVPVVGEK